MTLDYGLDLLEDYELDKAIAVFSHLTREDPTHHEAFCALASAYMESGEIELALEAISTAIDLQPAPT